MKKILVVVDMQNDFIDGALGTPEAVGIVDKVCEKIRDGGWDYIYTTQDTHDEMYLKTQEGRKLPVEHCMEGTEGWYLNEKIQDAVFGLKEWEDTFKETFASMYLTNEIAERLVYMADMTDADVEVTLVGVCTDICVISNALLLKAHFPEMRIIVDASCCAGTSPEKHHMALEVMKSCQIDVVGE